MFAVQWGPEMGPEQQIIHIHALAPDKPGLGAACNGCGVCCLAEPCPMGMLLSRRRTGACDALLWDPQQSQYRCGVLVHPREVLNRSLPRGLRWLTGWLAPLLGRLGVRWIAAGTGCDSSLEMSSATAEGTVDHALPGNSTTMPATAFHVQPHSDAGPHDP